MTHFSGYMRCVAVLFGFPQISDASRFFLQVRSLTTGMGDIGFKCHIECFHVMSGL